MSQPPVPRAREQLPGVSAASDAWFIVCLALIGGMYVALIVGMLAADVAFAVPRTERKEGQQEPAKAADEDRAGAIYALTRPEIRASIWLSLITCTLSTILSLWVGVPLGYLLSRTQFRGKTIVDTILDIPIVLPPLVIGLSLLILFQTVPGQAVQRVVRITYMVPAVVLAQFSVAAAFAVRTMRVTFDQIDPRAEQVALTLGCSRSQAFWLVLLPEARRGLLTSATLAWARSLGEFGPILVFAGATRGKTEVLSTTVFLELSVGNLEAALAVSLLMVAVAVVVLVITRAFGLRGTGLI